MAGVIAASGSVIRKSRRVPSGPLTGDAIVATAVERLECILDQTDGDRPECIGVAIPGLSDDDNGIWVYAPFSGVRDLPLGDILADHFGLPSFVVNDVNASAYGEKVFGACTGIRDFIWVTVSNGIGGGLVLDGKLYKGAFGNAGEIGHIKVTDDGEICGCGGKGCLEAHAAGPAIARMYAAFSAGTGHCTPVSAEEVATRARLGDASAQRAFDEAGRFIGKELAATANILNLQRAVIGGGVAAALDLLLPAIRRTLREYAFTDENRNLPIIETSLGYDAALVGAAAVAQKRMGWIDD